MSTSQRIGIGVVLVMALVIVIGGIADFSYFTNATRLENTINAKQLSLQTDFDNMWKTIDQTAQVTMKDRQTLSDIIVGNSNARNTGGKDAMMNWIKEAVPNISSEGFLRLQNIIVASRQDFTMRQKELIDLNREYTNLVTVPPSSIFLTVIHGKKPLNIKIVTSTRTEETFKTGKDDNTKLF